MERAGLLTETAIVWVSNSADYHARVVITRGNEVLGRTGDLAPGQTHKLRLDNPRNDDPTHAYVNVFNVTGWPVGSAKGEQFEVKHHFRWQRSWQDLSFAFNRMTEVTGSTVVGFNFSRFDVVTGEDSPDLSHNGRQPGRDRR